ncbi:hypothetical protein JCM19238_2190 [Vibrio ponticus]|nr:hypothetical protein JCM19238_2190 [Vibrio ponticus]
MMIFWTDLAKATIILRFFGTFYARQTLKTLGFVVIGV